MGDPWLFRLSQHIYRLLKNFAGFDYYDPAVNPMIFEIIHFDDFHSLFQVLGHWGRSKKRAGDKRDQQRASPARFSNPPHRPRAWNRLRFPHLGGLWRPWLYSGPNYSSVNHFLIWRTPSTWLTRRQRGRVVRAQDLKSVGPFWPLADVVLGIPEFNFSAALVNSQLFCLLPIAILNLVMFIWIFIYRLFVLVLKSPNEEWPIKYTFTFIIRPDFCNLLLTGFWASTVL